MYEDLSVPAHLSGLAKRDTQGTERRKMKHRMKPFLTYSEQIEKLKREKKLQIRDEKYAIRLLKEYSYFDLVSGYKSLFKRKDGTYKPHTAIEDIYALYCFDDKLRALILRYILKIEKHIKSIISYSFCEVNGEDQSHYLNATKYNYSVQNQEAINKLISKLSELVNNPKNYPYIRHQKKRYSNIPLWVMMKALTLGTVSKMYSFLPQEIQCRVSKEFSYVNEGMLVQMLDLLARVRNVCAHNERLYDYKYRKGTIDDTKWHERLGLEKRNGHYRKGKKDLFAVVIILKYLLDEDDFSEFGYKFDDIFSELLNKTRVLEERQLQKQMGFPENA